MDFKIKLARLLGMQENAQDQQLLEAVEILKTGYCEIAFNNVCVDVISNYYHALNENNHEIQEAEILGV